MKNNNSKMNNLYHFSIRKTSIGVGSVVIGIFLCGVINPTTDTYAKSVEDNIISVNEKATYDSSNAVIDKNTENVDLKNMDLDSTTDLSYPKENNIISNSEDNAISDNKKSDNEKSNFSNDKNLENTDLKNFASNGSTELFSLKENNIGEDKEEILINKNEETNDVINKEKVNDNDNKIEDKDSVLNGSPSEWKKVNNFSKNDQSVNFDKDWKFSMGEIAGAENKEFDDSSWSKLDLPHDFSINQDYSKVAEGESGYKLGGVGWYRKSFTVSDEALDSNITLQFDGSYMETEVFINGNKLGTHPYGYNAFSYDLTKYVKKNEENLVAVKVVNKTPSSRWYSGSGIYRSINLNFTPKTHLTEFGVSITTPNLEESYKQNKSVSVEVVSEIENNDINLANISIKNTIFNRNEDGSLGDLVAKSEKTAIQNIPVNNVVKIGNSLDIASDKLKLWSVENPNLYIVRTEVYKDDKLIQTSEQETGFRFTKFDKETGFSLNGENIKLKGVSMHHDQGALGAVAYYDAINRQVSILKDMGVNAIRVTHNPSSRVLREIANRKGMLLVDEAFDTWLYNKNGNIYDYSRYFDKLIGEEAKYLVNAKANQKWSEYHIKQMVRAGKNDPSVIMWSTGNEVTESIAGSAKDYPKVISNLIDWIKEEDTTRSITLGDNKIKSNNRDAIEIAKVLAEKGGIVGYNYANGKSYDARHKDYPDWIMYGSETASVFNSRGIYNLKGREQSPDKQVTSYDQNSASWGHLASEAWYDAIKRDFIAGEFVWTGFDYLGEPTPWNATGSGTPHGWPAPKSSYFGIVDTAGIPKDSYYFYASQWNKNKNVAHLLPAWEESVVKKDANGNVEVVAYSNAEKIKLYFKSENGEEKLIGTKVAVEKMSNNGKGIYKYKIYKDINGEEIDSHKNLYATWQVPYEKGTLRIEVYDKNDNIIKETFGTNTLKTFGKAKRLKSKITANKKVDDHSLAYVEVSILDDENNLVANAKNNIEFTVTGPAKIIAYDNGNPTDLTSYTENNRSAFSGKAIAILKMTGESGDIFVTAKSDGLESANSSIKVVADKKDIKDKEIKEYKLSKTIYIKKGNKLSLPKETTVRYYDGTEDKKIINFDTKELDTKLEKGETFIVKGNIADTNIKTEVVVSVIDNVAAMKNISQAIELGDKLELPKTAQAYLEDGTLISVQFPVVWEKVPEEELKNTGIILVKGKADVLGEEKDIFATVRIANKNISIGDNIAPTALTLEEDTKENKKSDTLKAINDKNKVQDPNLKGGPNPSLWSNYNSSQDGNKNSKLSFGFATAENISQVVIYYATDSYALTLPKEVIFKWTASKGDKEQVINATKSNPEANGNVRKIVYNLEKPVPAVGFNIEITNGDNSPGKGKATTGIVEVELNRAIESFNINNDATLSEIIIGDKTYNANQIVNDTLEIEGTFENVLAHNIDKNVAVTILPEKDNVVKIFTQSEDKKNNKEYKVKFLSYVPASETTLTAGSQQDNAVGVNGNSVNNAKDGNPDTIWHTEWSGTSKDNFWITLDVGKNRKLDALAYMQRNSGGANGKVINYEIYASENNLDGSWTKVAEGAFQNQSGWQEAKFNNPTLARYIKLKGLTTLGASSSQENMYMSASEVRVREIKEITEEPPKITPEKPKDRTPSEITDGTIALEDNWKSNITYNNNEIENAINIAINKEYEIYPSVQNISYNNKAVRLDNEVNIVISPDIDIYTINRLKETLQNNNISYTTSMKISQDKTNILLGLAGQNTQSNNHQKSENINKDLYNKIDAYSLLVKDNTISIVGKDTDAVFYGLTTLKHMLKNSDKPVLREVKIEDFANVKNRGFIEGYYGNPWSVNDRIELMRYGGELKMTQYLFAPKDDPYHNSKWRDMYPENKLNDIRELAKAGNQSKTRFVYTLHPFMHNAIRFDNNYSEDLTVIKNKFTQLLNVGVREFGILADDAARPREGFDSYNRLMKDLTNWLEEQQSKYSGLKKDMIFVPHEYWGNGSEDELKSLNKNLPKTTSMVLTGGKIWGEASKEFLDRLKHNLTSNGDSYKPVTLWLNWPCTDNSKEHLILGGGEKFLHPNIDPNAISGIILNPMQQSEPSKVALFSAAEYTWKIWKSEEEAKKINDIAFNFVNHNTFKDTPESIAFRELGKHMINQNMDTRVVKLEESVELAPKLSEFLTKLKNNEDLTNSREDLLLEFNKIKKAAELYKNSGNERLKNQIVYWLDNTIDQMNAIEKLLKATEYLSNNENKLLWDNYKQGRDLYEKSKTHKFKYVNEMKAAELGVQHIKPFIINLKKHLETKIEVLLDPTKLIKTFITNRKFEGDSSRIFDENVSTDIISKNPSTINKGDYVGVQFNKNIDIDSALFVMGRVGNLADTFREAEVEFMDENGNWIKVAGDYTGSESALKLKNINKKAQAIRLIATKNKENIWLGIRDILINKEFDESNKNIGTLTHSNNLIIKSGNGLNLATDENLATETYLANSNNHDNTPAQSWVQLSFEKEIDISEINIKQGVGDKIDEGILEYTLDGKSWNTLKEVSGEQNIIYKDNIKVKAVRLRNTKDMAKWWRIADFSIKTNQGEKGFTDTNVSNLKDITVQVENGKYKMLLKDDIILKENEYLGIKLDRIHEINDIEVSSPTKLSLLYSPNKVEWYSKNEIKDNKLVRYVRIVNETNSDKKVDINWFIVKTNEVQPVSLISSDIGIHPVYSGADVRNKNNLEELFDGKLNNNVEFANYPQKDNTIVINLGDKRKINKIRAYIQDGTQNYLRDGKIQVSEDGKNWIDVVEVGDGLVNNRKDDSLSDGWKHDSTNPGNRFIEGVLENPVIAKYLRIYITANYDHRFLSFTEMVINDGEFVKKVNNPTIESSSEEKRDSLFNNILDKKLETSYKVSEKTGELTYHLSEETNHNHIVIASNINPDKKVNLKVRIADDVNIHSKNVETKWIDLGTINSSFQIFKLPNEVKNLLDIKLNWDNKDVEIYELSTYYLPLQEDKITKVPTTFPTVEELPIGKIETKVLNTFPTAEELPTGKIETKVPNTFPTVEELPIGKIEAKVPNTFPTAEELPTGKIETKVPNIFPMVEELPKGKLETSMKNTKLPKESLSTNKEKNNKLPNTGKQTTSSIIYGILTLGLINIIKRKRKS